MKIPTGINSLLYSIRQFTIQLLPNTQYSQSTINRVMIHQTQFVNFHISIKYPLNSYDMEFFLNNVIDSGEYTTIWWNKSITDEVVSFLSVYLLAWKLTNNRFAFLKFEK
jgi:hypothetical protein